MSDTKPRRAARAAGPSVIPPSEPEQAAGTPSVAAAIDPEPMAAPVPRITEADSAPLEPLSQFTADSMPDTIDPAGGPPGDAPADSPAAASAASQSPEAAWSPEASWIAVAEAQAALARGCEAIAAEMTGMARSGIAATADATIALFGARTFSESVEINAGLARRGVDALFEGTARVSEIGVKAVSEASRPMASRPGPA